ncbi:tetratricopeptide repeat protein [Sansalvadorimonas verongulae]|uniref:tetratricopeptide repeat protein n=1 Tax=Sansalvadorimonas verongulae TaxID=2172824 RepID=UPI0018AD191D|nr:tetratricopeptide repeat protein [Sansalvadorimonas verongulae]
MGVLRKILDASGITPEGIGMLFQGHTIASIKKMDQQLLDAIYGLGHQNYQNEKFEKARGIMRYLCIQDHTNAEYFAALGACEYRLQNYEAAQIILEEAVNMDPQDPRPILNLSLCMIKNKNKKQAKALMQVAEQLSADKSEFNREWRLASRILEGSGKKKQPKSEG